MEELINIQKCIDKTKFLEMLDDCIRTLENMKEEIQKEIYYDEL